MSLRVLFLGRLEDIAGKTELLVEYADTVESIIARVEPALADALRDPRVRVAVNGNLTSREVPLGEGDEIAFLPPVSGG